MPHHTLGAMADKYRAIFTIRLGWRRVLVVSNWEMAKECYTTNDLAVSSLPTLVAVEQLSYNQAMFAFASHGPYWHEVRKIATLELLSNSRIQQLSHVRVSEVDSCVKALFQLWGVNKNKSSQVLVDLSQCFGELAMNAVLRTIAGKRYFGGRAEDKEEEEEARWCLKTLKEFVRLLGVFVAADALPCLSMAGFGWT